MGAEARPGQMIEMQGAKPKADVIHESALDVLVTLDKGMFLGRMSEELERLTKAVKDTGKGGKIKVVLEMTPADASKNSDGEVDKVWLTPKIDVTLPKPGMRAVLFYPTKTNTLVRRDPNQMGLPGIDEE